MTDQTEAPMAPRYDADRYTLVADIGGTNTRVALAEGPRLLAETCRRYRNADYAGLEHVLRRFIDEAGGVDCAGACVAVAGPVQGGVARMTNLDWAIDTDTLARATRAERVAILNDLQAQGHALAHLDPGAVDELRAGRETPGPGATRLVIGVGTGLNTATVYPGAAGTLVTASETGHIAYPAQSEEEIALCAFLRARHGFVALEDVLSGRGLAHIDQWLAGAEAPLRDGAAIMAAQGAGEARASAAVTHFARMLGAVAGNLALIHLPFGGVYLVGGVARAVAPGLIAAGFAQAFADKGRFSDFMGRFALRVVTDDYAALTGAASHLASHLAGSPAIKSPTP